MMQNKAYRTNILFICFGTTGNVKLIPLFFLAALFYWAFI